MSYRFSTPRRDPGRKARGPVGHAIPSNPRPGAAKMGRAVGAIGSSGGDPFVGLWFAATATRRLTLTRSSGSTRRPGYRPEKRSFRKK